MRFPPSSSSIWLKPQPLLLAAFLALTAVACGAEATAPPSLVPNIQTLARPTQTSTQTSTPAAAPESAGAGPESLASLSEDAFATLSMLIDELGPRESGTVQERRAAEYLKDRFESMGYTVELQPFTMERVTAEGTSLELSAQKEGPGALGLGVTPRPLSLSGTGEAAGELVAVDLAMAADLPDGGLAGKIALARRGIISFQEKVENLTNAGAVGVVIYNNLLGNFQGALSSRAQVPVVSVAQGQGRAMEDLLQAGSVNATLSVVMQTVESQNVVAQMKGTGNSVVVAGGHYDTLPEISGANDNSSGTAVVLALAKALAGQRLPFDLKFVAFGSEELGLIGSAHYVDALPVGELARTVAMLNFDALAAGPRVGILGDRELTDAALEFGQQLGVEIGVSPGLQGGSSDHASFAAAGVPVLMFFGDDVSRVHSERDTLEFVQPELLGGALAVAKALLESVEFAEIVGAETNNGESALRK